MEDLKAIPRRNNKRVTVYCSIEERQQIEANAQMAGLSASEFLRTIGMGYKAKGIVDLQQVQELAKVNGDLGRLGGLLKLWLTDDIKTLHYQSSDIRALLKSIEEKKEELGLIMQKIVQPTKRISGK